MESSKIILYIGETNSANKRWKGEHDCKNYLMNYKEALANNNLSSHQDIRFFLDVPKDCLLYTSPSPRDRTRSRMPSSA